MTSTSKAARLLSTGAILAAAAAVWPTIHVLRATPGGVDARLLWVLVPLLSSLGGFVAVRRAAWGPVWVMTGISCGFVVLTSWSIGLFFGPAALLLFVAAIAHLASTQPTWRTLLIPGWFVAGATTVCILFVLRDLALSRDVRIVAAPAIVYGAWIGVGAWALLILMMLPSWLHSRNDSRWLVGSLDGWADMNPVEVLREGAAELASILGPHGFAFVETGSGLSSGGHFASGEFRREDRRLELHVRWSLGLVTYHVGDASLSHAELTRAVAAIERLQDPPQYPGFSDEPLDAFRHLGADLVRFGQVFVQGTAGEFAALVAWVQQHPTPKGLAAL